jgi:phosphoserine phosphatase
MPRDETTPVVIFDLDGTILHGNSFPHWVLFLTFGRLREFGFRHRVLLSLRSLLLLLRRRFFGTSHEEFLWHLQDAWRAASAERRGRALDRFETKLLRLVRPNFASVLQLVATERIDAVLATAAAVDYAAGFGRRLGFRHVLATASNRCHGVPANSGACKREQVLAFLRGQGWHARPMILFTDHLDDLPLMRDSDTVYWFGPWTAFKQAAAAAANARFVFCRDLDGGEVASHLLDGCQADRVPASVSS